MACPPGSDYPAAMEAAERYAPGLEVVTVEGDFAYYDLLAEDWTRDDDMYLIEHDIVIREDTIRDLSECVCAWGGFAFLVMGCAFTAAFGATKFDRRLKRAYPNLWQDMITEYPRIPAAFQDEKGPRYWRTLDSRFAWMLERVYGFGVQCTHWPALPHLNPIMMGDRDPYEAASRSPNPKPHACWQGHFCRCLLGVTGHPCPARSGLDGAGVLVHTTPRLAQSSQGFAA